MNEQPTPPAEEVIEQQPPAPTPPEPEPELSLSEHEAQFNPAKKLDPHSLAEETPAEKTARESAAAQQARDRETGQFKTGKRRAKSQQASAEDAPRIAELTRKLRDAEERLARQPNGNGNGAAAPPPQAQPPQQPVVPQITKQGDRYVLPAPPFDPEPQEGDPRFAGDTFKFMNESARWSARQEARQIEFDRYVASEQGKAREAEQQIVKDFASRIDAAKAQHEDFEDVAFGPTPIRKDSIADIFITRDDNGAELLYYLHRSEHRQELDALLQMPELQQVKALTLLSQRLAPNGAGLTGGGNSHTTSVSPSRTIVLPPKPPNVVRTEAQRATGGPPTNRELSMSEHEQYYAPKQRR